MQKKSLEVKVGIFVIAGLAVIASLVVYFGRVGEHIQSYYHLDVTFPNAAGLLKGSSVYLSGAQIGRVTTSPMIVDNGNAVQVSVKIYSSIKISKDSRWTVSSAGLLGDKFVDVALKKGNREPYYADGEKVEGKEGSSLNELAEKAQPLVADAQEAVKELRDALRKINNDYLTEQTRENVQEAVAKMKSLMERVDSLMAQAQKGQGVIGTLLNNKEVAENLTAFIYNIRKHGVLFYSDSAERDKEKELKEQREQKENRRK